MKTEDQIKALAELDGWTELSLQSGCLHGLNGLPPKHLDGWQPQRVFVKDYLTSYDAIIPLIQKQDNKMKYKVSNCIAQVTKFNPHYSYDVTPSQLSEALLRATGKWAEK